ncbi:MAG TPA: asparagine synthase (glutamine-hydrolyzing) [Candidatus Binataceae bacterium]|nr:asparagine synthase (glutamine-hydrolyzing) [Candidatus Binataceae bacterium]
MCGLAAVFAYGASAPSANEREILKIRDAMIARGPDGAGVWMSEDRRVGLAHRRLALVDLSETGAQPMANADGSLVISFNGEIYNYRELRHELEGEGFRFRSTCDTEVLLHLYAARGLGMFNQLRGMYAFALWDGGRRRLTLARDPFGMKPLYYADDGRTIRVASQVKALIRGGGVASELDDAAQVAFFLLGYVPDPWTVHKKIKALPAGNYLTLEQSGARKLDCFCDISHLLAQVGASSYRSPAEDVAAVCEPALAESVRTHLMADVPVGVFLSAGLDSTTIAALSARAGLSRVHSITLGFKDYAGTLADETGLAGEVAKGLGLNHHTRWVTRADFEARAESLLAAMDQPSIDGVNTYFVSLAAHELGLKAALSGLGGDELFGSYPSYLRTAVLAKLARPIPKPLRAGFRHVAAPIAGFISSPKYASLLEYGGSYGAAYFLERALFMPWELNSVLPPEVVKRGLAEFDPVAMMEQTTADIEGDHLRVAALEMTWYMRNQLLRDADWAGMEHSVEIRMPMVDLPVLKEVMPAVAARPKMKKADFLAPILRQYGCERLLARPKTGFSVPVRDWLQQAGGKAPGRGLRGWASMIAKRFGFALV